jgi:hypothetical protein
LSLVGGGRRKGSSSSSSSTEPSAEVVALLREREAIKAAFISRKQAVRGLLIVMNGAAERVSSGTSAPPLPSPRPSLCPRPPRQGPALSAAETTAAAEAMLSSRPTQCDADFKLLDVAAQRSASSAAAAGL